jgi:hypothetical protein
VLSQAFFVRASCTKRVDAARELLETVTV